MGLTNSTSDLDASSMGAELEFSFANEIKDMYSTVWDDIKNDPDAMMDFIWTIHIHIDPDHRDRHVPDEFQDAGRDCEELGKVCDIVVRAACRWAESRESL